MGRFVFRVLIHELTGKGAFQDRLAQGLRAGKAIFDLGFHCFDVRKRRFEAAYDFVLFRYGTEWEWIGGGVFLTARALWTGEGSYVLPRFSAPSRRLSRQLILARGMTLNGSFPFRRNS